MNNKIVVIENTETKIVTVTVNAVVSTYTGSAGNAYVSELVNSGAVLIRRRIDGPVTTMAFKHVLVK